MEDMLGVAMVTVEEILTVQESIMVPVTIIPVNAMVVTAKIWRIGNILFC